jgi:DNA-binding Xre family transcriptional regulator
MLFKELFREKMKRENRLVDDTYPDMAKAMGISPRLAFELNHNRWAKIELIDAMCRYLGKEPGDLFVVVPDSIQGDPVKAKPSRSKK